MAVLQVLQADLLRQLDKKGPTLIDLRSATDLSLRATKIAAQAIGRSMASLTVTERHLWLTLDDMGEAERSVFLNAPLSPTALFSPAVSGLVDRFSEVQKASQAMNLFLPRRSSSAAGRSHTQPPARSSAQRPSRPPPSQQRQRGCPRSRSTSQHRPPPPRGPRPRGFAETRACKVLLAHVGRKRRLSPAVAGPPSKLICLPLPVPLIKATAVVFTAANEPVSQLTRLHSNATATQINRQKSIKSGHSAHADSVMSVVNMPTPQCSLLHTSTISPVYPTERTHIKRAFAARELNVRNVPTSQCPHLHIARSASHIQGLDLSKPPATGCVLIKSPVPAPQRSHSPVNTHMPALPQRLGLPSTARSQSAVQPAAAISEPPSPSTVTARPALLPLQVPCPAQCGGQDPEAIRTLAMSANAWKAIPGVSKWVLNTIMRGYSLQFRCHAPRFRARIETKVNADAAHLLHKEIAKLLRKGAIERVHPSFTEAGLYSRYFLVPKKDGALRPILDLRYLNKVLVKRPFKMLTTRQILA
ncbi:hypothetical protein PO909_000161 [Leuciscus waleckii]